MASTFPATNDSLSIPGSPTTTALGASSPTHSGNHQNLIDAIAAMQAIMDVEIERPQDHNLLGWSAPISTVSGTVSCTTGVQQFVRIKVPRTITITNLLVARADTTPTFTSGANNMAIYDNTGAWLKSTADMTTQWGNGSGFQVCALTSTLVVTGGAGVFVIVGAKTTFSAGTPNWGRSMGSQSATAPVMANAGLTATNSRSFTNGTNTGTLMQTTGLTLASNNQFGSIPWMGLS